MWTSFVVWTTWIELTGWGFSAAGDITLAITRRVEGAVYPADASGSECSAATYADTPCACFGGGAHRAGVINRTLITSTSDNGATSALAIDAGAYWYGSGLFYDEFNGLASAAAFEVAQEYAARGLSWRDFVSAARPDGDGTGGEALATFLAAGTLAAVATNLDVSGDDALDESHVVTHAIVESGGVKTAILALIDTDRLAAVSPHYAARCLPYENSLAVALDTTRGASPDLVVLFVALPVSTLHLLEVARMRAGYRGAGIRHPRDLASQRRSHDRGRCASDARVQGS